MTTCALIRDALQDALDAGEQPSAELQAHLDACESCAAWWQRMQQIDGLLMAPPAPAADDLADRILAATAAAEQPLLAWWKPALAAAAVILAAWLAMAGAALTPTEAQDPIALQSTTVDDDVQALMQWLTAATPEKIRLDQGLHGELAMLERDTRAVADFLLDCLPGKPVRDQP